MDDKARYYGFPQDVHDKYQAIPRDADGLIPIEVRADFVRDFQPTWNYWQGTIARFNMQPLWEDGAPGYNPDYGQPQPAVGTKIHDGEKRGMVLVCAGGGFVYKAHYECAHVADAFYDMGFNVAVLDYRVQPYSQALSIGDAKRALRYLRYNAEKFNTLPDHIAIMGFSAGGMLTNMCATGFDYGDPDAEDPIERVSCRPDAAIPCYGSFSMAAWPGKGLGYNRDFQKKAAQMSPDCLVNVNCPPFFIWQCQGADDPRNAMNLAGRLAVFGIPFELHLFPYGPHGTALSDGQTGNPAADDPHVHHWVEMCGEWLKIYGF